MKHLITQFIQILVPKIILNSKNILIVVVFYQWFINFLHLPKC